MANQICGWLGSSGSQILGYFCEEGSMNYGPLRLDNPRPIDVIHIGVVNDSVGEFLKENNWRHLWISDWDCYWNSWSLELEMSVSEVIDWSMRVTDCDTLVVNDWLQTWDYQSFGVSFGGPIGVSHWNLWTSVIARLCELVYDRLEGLLLRVLWESLILYIGCVLWGPVGCHVWPPRDFNQIHG